MEDKIVLIDRTVHYFELHPEFLDTFKPEKIKDDDKFAGLFSLIAFLAKSKDKLRYQRIGESLIFVQDVTFDEKEKIIYGKLRSVRMDVFPEIMDINTDIAKGIEAKETEGIVETTHFIINHTKKIKRLALEHNHVGAKIVEFQRYCEVVGWAKGAIQKMHYIPIQAENILPTFKERIGQIGKLVIRIHKDNISTLSSMDKQLHSSIKALQDQYTTEYVEITLGFDKDIVKQGISSNVDNLLTSLIADNKKARKFDILDVRARDAADNYRMHTFDFLIDKLKSTVKVQKKQKYRTIVSEDMFDKMYNEMKETLKHV